MRVLSAPTRLTGVSGFGLEIVDYVEPRSAPRSIREEQADEGRVEQGRAASSALTVTDRASVAD
jgi:hypothetical protein